MEVKIEFNVKLKKEYKSNWQSRSRSNSDVGQTKGHGQGRGKFKQKSKIVVEHLNDERQIYLNCLMFDVGHSN